MSARERPNAPALGPEPTPGGPLFWAGTVVGLGVVAFGLIGLLNHLPDASNWALWFVGGLLVHDGVIVPTVAVVSVLLGWLLPVRVLPVVQGVLVVAVVLVLVSIPVVGGWGRLANNPSLLPLDYGRNLSVVLGLVAAVGALLVLRALRRSAAPGRRPPSPEVDTRPRGW
jgi:hypothetical protein